MRSQPITQEARRHREMDAFLVEALELDPPEPAGEDILAQFRT
jgi:hypothetical protein